MPRATKVAPRPEKNEEKSITFAETSPRERFKDVARKSMKKRKRRQSLHDVVKSAYASVVDPEEKDHTHEEIHFSRAASRHLSMRPQDVDTRLAKEHEENSRKDTFRHIAFKERVNIASLFVHSAIEKRHVDSVDWKSPLSIMLFKAMRHPVYKIFVTSCAWVYMALTFNEVSATQSWASGASNEGPYSGGHWCDPKGSDPCVQNSAMLFLETFIVLVLFGDAVISVYTVSVKTYFKDRIKALWFTCVAYMMFDLFFTQYVFPEKRIFRFSRVLRPMYILRTRRRVRNILVATAETIPNLKEFLAFFTAVIICFAIAGVQLFGEVYIGENSTAIYESKTNLTVLNETATVELYQEHFNGWGGALVTLLILATGENYPDVMMPAINRWAASGIFFVLYIAITLFLFMPVLMAIVFEYYKRHHGVKLLQEKIIERKALLAAFDILDSEDSHTLDFKTFYALIAKMKNIDLDEDKSVSKYQTESKVLFRMVDRDGSGEIDRVEFLKLCDILLIKIRVRPVKTLADIVDRDKTTSLQARSRNRKQSAKERRRASWSLFWRRAGKRFAKMQEKARTVVLHPAFDITTAAIVVLYLCVMIYRSTEQGQSADGKLFTLLEVLFLALFGFEVVVKISALGHREYFNDGWNMFDFSVIVVSITMFAVAGEGSAIGAKSVSIFRVARLVRVFTRTMYLMSHVQMLRVLLATFAKLVGILGSVFGFIFIMIYVLMIFGMELFGSNEKMRCPEDNRYCASFEDSQHAFLTCFQLLVGESWGDIMYRGMTAGGRFYYWILFTLFYMVLNMLVLNIMGAMVLEVFTIEMEKSQEEEKQKHRKGKGAGKRAASEGALFPAALVDEYDEAEQAQGDFIFDKSVRSAFAKYDEDDDGSISLSKVKPLFEELGVSVDDKMLRRVLPDDMDLEAADRIELVEFLNLFHSVRVNLLFMKYDADGSGFIDPDEIPSLLHEHSGHVLTESEIKQALKALDTNKDGHVSLVEFESWWDDFDARKHWNSIQTDKDGKVSLSKLQKLLFGLMGEDWVQRKSSWVKSQIDSLVSSESIGRAASMEEVRLDFEQFVPWYKSVFRHTKHLIADDDVVVTVGKTTKWEEAIFADPAASSSVVERKSSEKEVADLGNHVDALIRAVAADYGLSVNTLLRKFKNATTRQLKDHVKNKKMSNSELVLCSD